MQLLVLTADILYKQLLPKSNEPNSEDEKNFTILKELNLDNMISNSIFLRDVVKKISRDGYDIYDNPFKLVRYK